MSKKNVLVSGISKIKISYLQMEFVGNCLIIPEKYFIHCWLWDESGNSILKSENLTGKWAFWIKDLKYKCSLYHNDKVVRLKKDEKNSEHLEIIGIKISSDLVKLPQHHNHIDLQTNHSKHFGIKLRIRNNIMHLDVLIIEKRIFLICQSMEVIGSHTWRGTQEVGRGKNTVPIMEPTHMGLTERWVPKYWYCTKM